MSVKVIVIENGVQQEPVWLMNADEMYIQAGPPAIYQVGRYLALKMKIKSLERINENLRIRLAERDLKTLAGASVDELLDELKLRSEYFV